jgi:aminoglycoside phosphotransferase
VSERVHIADGRVWRVRDDRSPLVEAFLRYLTDCGFGGSPRVRGVTADGRQELDHVPGIATGSPPWQSDDRANAEALGSVARVLRELHDVSVGFCPPSSPAAPTTPAMPGDRWTHGDVVYSNLVFDTSGKLVGLIDWEHAGPAHPLSDCGTLLGLEIRGPRPDADDQPRREEAARRAADAIADQYGMDDIQRSQLPLAAAAALRHVASARRGAGTNAVEIDRLMWRSAWFEKRRDLFD